MGKLLQCHLKGKTCNKLANGLNLYDLKTKLTPEVALTLPWGYIHVYYHSSQTSLLVYGLRWAFTGLFVLWFATVISKHLI